MSAPILPGSRSRGMDGFFSRGCTDNPDRRMRLLQGAWAHGIGRHRMGREKTCPCETGIRGSSAISGRSCSTASAHMGIFWSGSISKHLRGLNREADSDGCPVTLQSETGVERGDAFREKPGGMVVRPGRRTARDNHGRFAGDALGAAPQTGGQQNFGRRGVGVFLVIFLFFLQ